jgi:hypothetical protein
MHWALALLIIGLPTYLVRFSIAGIPTTLFEIVLYLLTIWTLVSHPIAYSFEKLLPAMKRYGWAIGLFVLGAVIATVIAPDLRTALGLLKAYIFDPLLLAGLVVIHTHNKRRLQLYTFATIASGVFVAISTLFSPPNAEGRALGIYGLGDQLASPNFMALFLAPLCALGLALALTAKERRDKAIYWTSFIIMLVGLGLSGSRGGLLAVTVGSGLIILGWIHNRVDEIQQSLVKLLSVVFIAVSIAVGWYFAKPDLSATPEHRVATSNNLRYEIWRTTIVDVIPDNFLFGVGLGNYQNYFTEITKDRVNFPEYISPWARSPHNLFLTLWTNIGLLGIIGFIWLLWQFFANRKSGKVFPASVYSVTIITLLVHGLVDASYWKNDLAALFWLIIALDYVNQYLEETRHGKS